MAPCQLPLTHARAPAPPQYEEQLEALRRLRKRAQNAAAEASEEDEEEGEGRGGGRRPAPSAPGGAGDHAILRRIHFLYERALRKFRGDLRLWVRPLCSARGRRRPLRR